MPNQLFTALKKNDKEEVRQLLASGLYTANDKDEKGYPALLYTVKFYPNPEMAEILLQYGATPNFTLKNGHSLISLLIDHGHSLYHYGEMKEGGSVYEDFFRLANSIKKFGAVATQEDLVNIERTVGNVLNFLVKTDYIHDKYSFERKLVELFANESHQFQRVELEGVELELYQANEKAKLAIVASKIATKLEHNPIIIENRPGAAQSILDAVNDHVQVADRLLTGIIARVQARGGVVDPVEGNDQIRLNP